MSTGSALSRYVENALLNWIKGTTFPAAPGTVYVALFTAAPTDTGGGSEVSGGSYARVSATFGAISNADPTGGKISNSGAVTWAIPTASWGTVTHVALFDASSGGNMLIYGALAAPVVVGNGMNPPFSFAVGSLILGVD